jgi:predicted NBD/HSP70 family sugar kinase
MGIDVGGTKIRAGLVDRPSGRVDEEIYAPSPVDGGRAALALCAGWLAGLRPTVQRSVSGCPRSSIETACPRAA